MYVRAFDESLIRRASGLLTLIDLPVPKIGGKAWLLGERGRFVLEQGPGVLRTIACTHAGSGSMAIYDGVPESGGQFADEDADPSDPGYYARPGRLIYKACPVVMGSWMLDAGFNHGLTVFADSGNHAVSCTATIVWMPFRAR